jgi:DNA repair photolyase
MGDCSGLWINQQQVCSKNKINLRLGLPDPSVRSIVFGSEQKANHAMSSLFPQPEAPSPLVGIARLAAEGEAIAEGHQVEYLTLENRTLLTKCQSPRMPFQWMINPYRGCEFACKYCYARYTHEFMELRDGLDFERLIFVKQNAAWFLRQELKAVRKDERIAIGTATDPYQPAERKFAVTQAILQELAAHKGLNIGLITKSDMILRDTALLREIHERNRLSISVTITTMNTDLARRLEPRAPRPDLRMKAVQQLALAGLHVGVNCAPVLPQITDSPRDLEELVRCAGDAGAAFVFCNALFLKPCAKNVFIPFLRENFPKLVATYEQLYADRAYLPTHYGDRVSALVRKLSQKFSVGRHGHDLSSTRYSISRWIAPSATQLGLF